MKVVISLGGSVLTPLDRNKINQYVDVLIRVARSNALAVVTGGGLTAREYIKVARELGVNEAMCDQLGIDATRMNARLLINAMDERAHPYVPLTCADAMREMAPGRVVIMGGTLPGHTTDAVAAILAECSNADLFINVTSVDGVYTADPKKDPDAEKLDQISADDLVKIIMKMEMKAGPNTVMDLLAAKIIQRSQIPTIVISGEHPEDIIKAVKGDHQGTEITFE